MLSRFSTLVGCSLDLVDARIFQLFAASVMPAYLFKPVGFLLAVHAVIKPPLEENPDKKVLKYLGYIPAGFANVAILFFEGSAAAGLFSVSVTLSGALLIAEIAYKQHKKEEFTANDKLNILITTAKSACILATLNLGGTGKIFELIKEGIVSNAHKNIAYATSFFSLVSAAKGFTFFAKSFFSAKEKRQEPISLPSYGTFAETEKLSGIAVRR